MENLISVIYTILQTRLKMDLISTVEPIEILKIDKLLFNIDVVKYLITRF